MNIQPLWKESNGIEIMMLSIIKKIKAEFEHLTGSFQFKPEVSEVERKTLL